MAGNLTRSNAGRGLARSPGFPMLDFRREMDRLFDQFLEGWPLGLGMTGTQDFLSAPRLDIQEKDKELCVIADVPGVTESDLDLMLEGDILTIRGEKKEEEESDNASYHLKERRYGQFERSVQLPFAPDPSQVRAEFENGVLRVTMPRQGEQQRARRIEIGGPRADESQSGEEGEERPNGPRGQQRQGGQGGQEQGGQSSATH